MVGVSLTFTGTTDEIADVLAAVSGPPSTSATVTGPKVKAAVKDAVDDLKDLENKTFTELKRLAVSLGIDPAGKKSAGLRKAIVAKQAESDSDDEEEEDDLDDDDDDDWEDDDEESEDDDEEDLDDEEDEDEDEDEEDEPEPPKKKRGRPAKAPARKTPARRKTK